MQATIHERGNGLPDAGDHVPGTDGELYLILSISGHIDTGLRPGEGNWCHATVALADWDDIEDDADFPASCIVGDDAD